MNTSTCFLPVSNASGVMAPTPAVIVSYPNTRGALHNYSVEALNHYFRRYSGGVVDFFCEGVRSALDSDFPGFMDRACEVFQGAIDPLMQCNALNREQWDKEYRHFRHMVLELWRYIRSTLHAFLEIEQYSQITVLRRNIEQDEVVLCLTAS